jgi:hypothetical protein
MMSSVAQSAHARPPDTGTENPVTRQSVAAGGTRGNGRRRNTAASSRTTETRDAETVTMDQG